MKTIKGWAVVTKGKQVLGIEPTREQARELKSFFGGKAEGVKIVKLEGSKEVR